MSMQMSLRFSIVFGTNRKIRTMIHTLRRFQSDAEEKPVTRIFHYVINCLILGFVIGLVLGSAYCTAPVNVNVKAESWQCQTEIQNESGSVDFKNCEKTDGQAPVDQDATDGEDKLEISRFVPNPN